MSEEELNRKANKMAINWPCKGQNTKTKENR